MHITTSCCGCKQKLEVKSNLTIRKIEFPKVGNVDLKILTCPHCGKEMTVQVDNEMTTKLLVLQLDIMSRIGKTLYYSGKPTQKQISRRDRVSRRLAFERATLAARLDGSSYQFDGAEKKLEVSAPTAQIVGETEEFIQCD